jgi:hypothetical protein
MRLINLSGSTLLAAVGYNPTTRDFVAQFHQNGKFYAYEGVTPTAFVLVITDEESQGKAFNKLIKSGPYPYREVTAEDVKAL